jgi:ribosomal protein S7
LNFAPLSDPIHSADEIELNPYRIFEVAVENATPMLRLARVRRGGTNYQVEFSVNFRMKT